MESKTGARDVMSKLDEIIMPAFFHVFQSTTNGVCEVHDDSSVEILYTPHSENSEPKVIRIPPKLKYIEQEE